MNDPTFSKNNTPTSFSAKVLVSSSLDEAFLALFASSCLSSISISSSISVAT